MPTKLPYLELNAELSRHVPRDGTFDCLMNLDGKVYRQVKHRRTLEFEAGGRHYFIKIHRGCGWGEIVKDFLSARPPVISARSEWEAIERLRRIGIRTMKVAGRGERGINPAERESFIITEALENMVSLEDLTKDWGGLKGRRRDELKRALLNQIAALAKIMHRHGLNHRDFYLCHFLVEDRPWKKWRPGDSLELHLIDLHRMQSRRRVPLRWRVKDLASLLHSSLDARLTRRDLLHFVRIYEGRPWNRLTPASKKLWNRIWRHAHWLYRGFHKREPPAIP